MVGPRLDILVVVVILIIVVARVGTFGDFDELLHARLSSLLICTRVPGAVGLATIDEEFSADGPEVIDVSLADVDHHDSDAEFISDALEFEEAVHPLQEWRSCHRVGAEKCVGCPIHPDYFVQGIRFPVLAVDARLPVLLDVVSDFESDGLIVVEELVTDDEMSLCPAEKYLKFLQV